MAVSPKISRDSAAIDSMKHWLRSCAVVIALARKKRPPRTAIASVSVPPLSTQISVERGGCGGRGGWRGGFVVSWLGCAGRRCLGGESGRRKPVRGLASARLPDTVGSWFATRDHWHGARCARLPYRTLA